MTAITAADNQHSEWNNSYQRRENYVFWPHEEIVRFVARHIRKRVGIDEYVDVIKRSTAPRLLDLGCGIGRHVIFGHQQHLDTYGIDLSDDAVAFALDWMRREGIEAPERFVTQGDIRTLPWQDGWFDAVISHGVLDSMPFAIAHQAMPEVHRVLKPGGLFYCDLVSGDDARHAREYAGEEIVESGHETGTVQSYFNFAKLAELVQGRFDIAECTLIRREDILTGSYISRYHVVLARF